MSNLHTWSWKLCCSHIVPHPAAPFAARVLDQPEMITDIVAHGPEVAQGLSIDCFQCELGCFTRVAYPPRSPEGNSSLALSMHHLLWDQTQLRR